MSFYQKKYDCEYCRTSSFTTNWKSNNISKYLLLSSGEVKSREHSTLYCVDGRILKPDSLLNTGDWHLYWINESERIVKLCSRNCAIKYSVENNKLLLTSNSSSTHNFMLVTPQQEVIDDWLNKNNIKLNIEIAETGERIYEEKQLPQKNQKDEHNLEETIRFLERFINGKYYHISFESLVSNIRFAIENGYNRLAFDAIKIAIKKQPESFVYFSNLLFKIGEIAFIDSIYEKQFNRPINYRTINPEILGRWGLYISSYDEKKSLMLLEYAYRNIHKIKEEFEDYHNMIIDNYSLMLANNNHPIEDIIRIMNERKGGLSSTSYFNLGSALCESGKYREALEYLYLAFSIIPDNVTKFIIAKCNYYLGNYFTSLQYLDFLKSIEDIDHFVETDGITYNTLNSTSFQDDILANGKLLLGRIYIKTSEHEKGRELIIQALETNSLLNQNKKLRDEIEKEIGIYKTKDEIRLELDSKTISLECIQKSYELKIKEGEKLHEIIEVIGKTQKLWANAIDQITDEVQLDQISSDFSARLCAFHQNILKAEKDNYERIFSNYKLKYYRLTESCIESLTNASVLYETLKNSLGDNVNIYSGVVCELSQAIEIELNEKIVFPFSSYLKSELNQDYLLINDQGKQTKLFLYDYNGNPRSLMYYDIERILKSEIFKNISLLLFKQNKINLWILNTLPQLIQRIRIKYRNGYIHEHKAKASLISDFKRFLDDQLFFETLCLIDSKN